MKLRRLSYSSLKLFERCRKAWGLRYLVGAAQLPSAAAERGKRLHSAAERFVKGEIPEANLPVQFIPFMPTLSRLFRYGAGLRAEEVWYADPAWRRVEKEEDAACMAIIDLNYRTEPNTLHITDYKSGRMYPEHAEQLEFYAMMAVGRDPTVERVIVDAWYIDIGKAGVQAEYRREWLELLMPKWTEKMAEVRAAKKFPATVGRHCGWCAYRTQCTEGQQFLTGGSCADS